MQAVNLSHTYNPGSPQAVKALRGVELAVNRGEIVAIVGANGSGKSTFVRHLNALLLPTGGTVKVGGIDTKDGQQHLLLRQKVGMVFQNPDNQLVGTTVEEDVAFGPENLGLPRATIEDRITAALAAVDMSAHRRRPPHQLSGGQKQRVAIAGVLAMKPEVMVLDEPTAMLDPQGRAEVMDVLRQLNRQEGMTIIFTTHFMDEAAQAHTVALMVEGRIRRVASPADLFAHPQELKQAGLELPLAGQLAAALRRRSFPLPLNLFTEAELVDGICQSSSNN